MPGLSSASCIGLVIAAAKEMDIVVIGVGTIPQLTAAIGTV